MSNRIRWGILGTGNIARRFAAALKQLPDAELAAVGSRSLAKAREFAYQLDIPYLFGSYDELANDRHIDVVYVATPHPLHVHWGIRAAEAGKNVLCEKPLGVDCADAMALIAAAKKARVFLAEARAIAPMPYSTRAGEAPEALRERDAATQHSEGRTYAL